MSVFHIRGTCGSIDSINNTAATYDRFFSVLLEMRPSLRPACIMMDFEKAIMRTFSDMFTETILLDVFFFYFCKSIYRKVVDIGCNVKYQTDQEFNT